jgi:hypothetical protein
MIGNGLGKLGGVLPGYRFEICWRWRTPGNYLPEAIGLRKSRTEMKPVISDFIGSNQESCARRFALSPIAVSLDG